MTVAYVITDLAEKAYSAYGESTGGKTFDGRDMPEWANLRSRPRHRNWPAAFCRHLLPGT